MSEDIIRLNGYQIKRLMDFVDGEDETEVCISYCADEREDLSSPGEMMPPGYYVWCADYPEEGSMWLPETPEDHMRVDGEPRSTDSGGVKHGD